MRSSKPTRGFVVKAMSVTGNQAQIPFEFTKAIQPILLSVGPDMAAELTAE
jgi:hypothetical protein